MDKSKREKPMDEILAERLLQRIVVKQGCLHLAGEGGGKLSVLAQGDPGETGQCPKHEWKNTSIRFENPDGSWGAWTDLRGVEGERGAEGKIGRTGQRGDSGSDGINAITEPEIISMCNDITLLKARVKKLEKK